GRVILWNDALEQIVGCPRSRALGSTLASAVPAVANSELNRAVDEALANRGARTLVVSLRSGADARTMAVKLLPVDGGVTLGGHDVAGRASAERAVKRSERRLALAAEGANDGWWEWDLRAQELYVSGRWRSLLGTLAPSGIARPEEWTGRIHAEDASAFQ